MELLVVTLNLLFHYCVFVKQAIEQVVKQQIESDYKQLHQILNNTQLQEIKESLNGRCTRLAPTYSNKAKHQFERPTATKVQPKRRKVIPKNTKGRNQDELQKFMFQLKKLLK